MRIKWDRNRIVKEITSEVGRLNREIRKYGGREVNEMATKKAAKKGKATGGGQRTGVCARGYELIRKGMTNQQVLAALQKSFPTSNIKIGGVGWLRNKLRETEKGIKTNRELIAGKTTGKKKAA